MTRQRGQRLPSHISVHKHGRGGVIRRFRLPGLDPGNEATTPRICMSVLESGPRPEIEDGYAESREEAVQALTTFAADCAANQETRRLRAQGQFEDKIAEEWLDNREESEEHPGKTEEDPTKPLSPALARRDIEVAFETAIQHRVLFKDIRGILHWHSVFCRSAINPLLSELADYLFEHSARYPIDCSAEDVMFIDHAVSWPDRIAAIHRFSLAFSTREKSYQVRAEFERWLMEEADADDDAEYRARVRAQLTEIPVKSEE